eukprot:TRINITY_DN1877_c0_g1_i1.p1 TRINITY_DN1877_c0_g1~~TRINITY_DN1877_c0_g1_i1.p1  ORF type:complete len:133 (-),score=22.78 TRINITY_DN1877_c0_g1_i1:187-585(-)
MLNIGTESWPEGTKLLYNPKQSTLPSVQNEYLVNVTKPSKYGEIAAAVKTPSQPGRYQAFFQLIDNERKPFGQRLWCDVVVIPSIESNGPLVAPSAPQIPGGNGGVDNNDGVSDRAKKMGKTIKAIKRSGSH